MSLTSRPKAHEPASLVHTEAVLSLIKGAHQNTKHSDMTITCQGKTFHIHKLVVCPRSAFFDRVCDNQFKGPICLDDRDPILIEQVLEYLYTGDITDSYFRADGEIPPDDSVFYHGSIYQRVRLYAEADYFKIDDLKQKMTKEFRRSFLPYGFSGPLSVSPNDEVDYEVFEDVIEEIYSARADYRELRKVAIDNIKENLVYLRGGDSPILELGFLKANLDFTHDLCVATLNKFVVEPKPVTGGQITPAQMKSGHPGFASQSQSSAFGAQPSTLMAQPSTIVAQPSTYVTQPPTFGAPLVAQPCSFGAQPALRANQPAVYGTMTVSWRS